MRRAGMRSVLIRSRILRKIGFRTEIVKRPDRVDCPDRVDYPHRADCAQRVKLTDRGENSPARCAENNSPIISVSA